MKSMRQVLDRGAVEDDVADRVAVEATDAVEHHGLAGAVGADQAADLAAPDIEADAGQGHDAAEAHRHAGHAQQRAGTWRGPHRRSHPRGEGTTW
jgi:hypothetical protein